MKNIARSIYHTSSVIVTIAALVVVLRPAIPQTKAASMPSAPGVGMVVNYVLPQTGPNGGQVRPAIILEVDDNQSCDLILFDTAPDAVPPGLGVRTSVLQHATHDEHRAAGSWQYVDRNAPETNQSSAFPTLTGIDPNSGPPGTVVTLTGTHLKGVTAVLFGGAVLAFPGGIPGRILQATDTSIVVVTPVLPFAAPYAVFAVDASGFNSNALGYTQIGQ